MDWAGLWQGVLSNLLYGLIILGAGALLAALRIRWPSYAEPARYALTGAAGAALILFALLGKGISTKSPPETTAENLETNIRKWADDAGLPIAKAPPTAEGIYFGYTVTATSGVPISVFRAKQKPGFLQMQCALFMSAEHLSMMAKLTKEQADDAMEEIILEMDRSRIGFVMTTGASLPLLAGQTATTKPEILQQTIVVTKPIAVSRDLNEGSFLARIDEIDSEVGVVKGITDLTLKRYAKQQIGESATRRK